MLPAAHPDPGWQVGGASSSIHPHRCLCSPAPPSRPLTTSSPSAVKRRGCCVGRCSWVLLGEQVEHLLVALDSNAKTLLKVIVRAAHLDALGDRLVSEQSLAVALERSPVFSDLTLATNYRHGRRSASTKQSVEQSQEASASWPDTSSRQHNSSCVRADRWPLSCSLLQSARHCRLCLWVDASDQQDHSSLPYSAPFDGYPPAPSLHIDACRRTGLRYGRGRRA
jgi:hypothetical protein